MSTERRQHGVEIQSKWGFNHITWMTISRQFALFFPQLDRYACLPTRSLESRVR